MHVGPDGQQYLRRESGGSRGQAPGLWALACGPHLGLSSPRLWASVPTLPYKAGSTTDDEAGLSSVLHHWLEKSYHCY